MLQAAIANSTSLLTLSSLDSLQGQILFLAAGLTQLVAQKKQGEGSRAGSFYSAALP